MKTTVVTKEGKILSPLTQKYLDILKSKKITNNEIIALCSLINSNKIGIEEKREIIHSISIDNPLKLTPEQNKKGYDFLMDQWKTSKGIERKNNPFGYREQKILEKFTDFELIGLYDAGNYLHSHYIPLYACNGNENSFEYYYNGKVNIIG